MPADCVVRRLMAHAGDGVATGRQIELRQGLGKGAGLYVYGHWWGFTNVGPPLTNCFCPMCNKARYHIIMRLSIELGRRR